MKNLSLPVYMMLGVKNLFNRSVDEGKQFWGYEGYPNCRIVQKA